MKDLVTQNVNKKVNSMHRQETSRVGVLLAKFSPFAPTKNKRSISRITFQLLVFLCALGVLIGRSSQVGAQPDQQSDRPNVLFIAVDDLNDWIGVLNTHPQVKTPNIDRLAGRGTLFINAHAQATVCNPSRVSLLTGLRPTTTGIYGLVPGNREAPTTQDVVTLPQYFGNHGYRTYSTGKIYHHMSEKVRETDVEYWGPDGGFGPFPDNKLVQKPLDMVQHLLVDWGVFPEQDSLLDDYRVTTWGVNRLKEFGAEQKNGVDKEPFFLAVGIRATHVPLYAPQKWFDLYPENQVVLPPAPEGDRDDVPFFAWYLNWYLPEPRLSWAMENNEWKPMVRAYLATISYMDAQVGRLLSTLKEQSLEDNTIVVLWSDQGYHLGEKAITGKNSLWQETTHVPLIFAGPGVSVGAKSSEAVELLDIYPTLVDLADLPPKEDIEGLSLVPQLEDASTPRERPAVTTSNPGNYAVNTERWTYIRYANGSEELYDCWRDPYQWKNLANNSNYEDVKENLGKWISEEIHPHVPGARGRVLWQENGQWYWEGEPILFKELIK